MDPAVALAAALTGAAASRTAYNEWVKNGGFQAVVNVREDTDTWSCGIREVSVQRVHGRYVHGSHPLTGTKVRLPITVLEVE